MTERLASTLPSVAGAPTPSMVDEAIDWALKTLYGVPDAPTRDAFERWLAADARHGLAWERVQSLAGEFRGLPPRLAHDTLQAREALRRRRRRAFTFKALGLAAMLGASSWVAREHAPWQRLLADASTGTGERRALRLADGSRVTLNTDSAIAVRLGAQERLLTLLRGEIFIETGRDAESSRKRPFRVATPQGRLEALGTKFLVRLEPDAARVGVRAGAVALQPRDGGTSTVAGAGEQWLMDGHGSRRLGPAAFEPDGWLNGVIVARRMSLAAFLAELDRYRPGYLAVDPRVADRPVTGVYQLQDIDGTLRFLAQAQGLRLIYRSRYWVTVAPAGA